MCHSQTAWLHVGAGIEMGDVALTVRLSLNLNWSRVFFNLPLWGFIVSSLTSCSALGCIRVQLWVILRLLIIQDETMQIKQGQQGLKWVEGNPTPLLSSVVSGHITSLRSTCLDKTFDELVGGWLFLFCRYSQEVLLLVKSEFLTRVDASWWPFSRFPLPLKADC